MITNSYTQAKAATKAEEKITFDFVNQEIKDVAQQLSEQLGKPIIVDPMVTGKISLSARATLKETYEMLLSALAIRGFTIVQTGKVLKIVSQQNVKQGEIQTVEPVQDSDRYITKLIPIKYISANELVNTLKAMAPNIIAYTPTNTLIITDAAANIKRIMKIIANLDVKGFEEKTEFIKLQYAAAKDIADKISQIMSLTTKEDTRYGYQPISRFRGEQQVEAEKKKVSSIIADERTNSLIVKGTSAGIKDVKLLVKQFDSDITNERSTIQIFVYRLEHAEAKALSDILSNMLSGGLPIARTQTPEEAARYASPFYRSPTSSTKEGTKIAGSEEVKISADEKTNSLIILTSKVAYESLLPTIRELDKKRKQVHLEASIMEVFLTDKFEFGLSGHGGAAINGGSANNGYTVFGGSSPGNNPLLGGSPDVKSLIGLIGGFASGPIKLPSNFEIPGITAFLKASKIITDAKVISKPSILTLENEPAKIEVGVKKWILTAEGSQTSTTYVAPTYTPTDANLTLEITPKITRSDFVTMKIKQVISDFIEPETKEKKQPDIATRKAETVAMAQSKETIAIGGLISDEVRIGISKVPVLGDIPVLGWLFKNKTKHMAKKNLVIFITPTVLDTSQDIAESNKKIIQNRNKFYEQNKVEVDDWIGSSAANTHPAGVVINYGKEKDNAKIDKDNTLRYFIKDENKNNEDGIHEYIPIPEEKNEEDVEVK
jgi:general secretion pathway protein D